MTDTEVERIVVEVVRRLLAGERGEAPRAETAPRAAAAMTSVAADKPARITPTTSLSSIGGVMIQRSRVSQITCETGPAIPRGTNKPDPCAAWRVGDDTLACDDPLLTLGKFAGGLDGVRRLIVSPRAVVTPSLKEELNRRGIEVDRKATGRALSATGAPRAAGEASQPAAVTASAGPAACGRLLVVEFDCSQKIPWAKAIAAVAGTVDHLACDSLAVALEAVSRHVSCGGQLAVILTRHAAAVACAANRAPAIRAAATSSIDAVAMVARSMAANVLTIDPSRHSRYSLQAMANQFMKAPRREIRAELEGHV